MAQINWGLGIMPDVGMNAFAAFKAGQEEGRNRRADNALAAYVAQPGQDTLAGVVKADPRLGLKVREMEAERASAARSQRRADLPTMVRLIEGATDEASWQSNLALAQEYGIDVSSVPRNFDPAWREQNLAAMRLLASPQGQEALSTIGKQAVDMGFQPGTPEFNAKVAELWQVEQNKLVPTAPGGGVAQYNPATGQTEYVIVPNYGGAQPGAPVGSAPQPGTVEDGYRFKGGNPADPNNWEQVGGGGSNATGNFLGGL